MDDTKERIHYWDNVKGFLIILVVFGHLLEQLPNGQAGVIYKLIYTFHMPLFIFCSGYLTNYSPQKIVKRLLLPYLLLQPVCCIFTSGEIQMTRPFWGLWYLPALAVWRSTVPFLETKSQKSRLYVILASLICGCAAGADDTIGYYGTLSRIIVFYPYFIAGYYLKQYFRARKRDIRALRDKDTIKIISVLSVMLAAVVFCFFCARIDAKWLYEAYSYEGGNYNMLVRAAHYLMAAAMGGFVLLVMPGEKTVFSALGYNSFAIYLTHIGCVSVIGGFFVSLDMSRLLQYFACLAASVAFCVIVVHGRTRMLRIFF